MQLIEWIKKIVFIFLVIAALIFAKDFLIPLSIGGVLATLFLPICKWLEQKKLPRIIAVCISIMLFLVFVFGIMWLVFSQVSGITNDLELLKERIVNVTNELSHFVQQKFGISIANQLIIFNNRKDAFSNVLFGMAGSMIEIAAQFFLILVYIFGFLFYRHHIKSFLLQLFTLEKRDNAEAIIYKVSIVSQQYLLGLAKMIFLLWIMYGIGFSIIGVKNAIFFAILCGILEIVPFVGNLTGTLITVMVSAVQGASSPMLIAIVCTYGLIQFIQGWFLEPLILGPQVKINPFFTIIALILGELIWGLPGVFLAIPLMAMIKIICDSVQSLKPYGFLIGELNQKPIKTT